MLVIQTERQLSTPTTTLPFFRSRPATAPESDVQDAAAHSPEIPFVPDALDAATATLNDLLDVYAREYLPRQARNTQGNKRRAFRWIRRELGEIRLIHLTPARLRQWRDQLSQRVAPTSVTTYLGLLSSVLKVAVCDLDWLPSNPMAKVVKPPQDLTRARFLSMDEQGRLLAACQRSKCAFLTPIVLLAMTTGARQMEILMRPWDDLDLEEGVLRLERTKTKLKRPVPMPTMTVAALRRWHAIQDSNAWVFPGPRLGVPPAAIDRPWMRALAAAQIDDFHFHDLRHTAASYLAMNGVRIEDIAVILGHKNIQTTMRYRHLITPYTADLVEQMAQKFIHPQPDRGPEADTTTR